MKTAEGIPLKIICSCKSANYIVVPDLQNPYKAKCTNCGKYVFQLTCSKCGNGFGFPENVPNLKIGEGKWFCDTGHHENTLDFNSIPEVMSKSKNELGEKEKKVLEMGKVQKFVLAAIVLAIILLVLL